MDNKRTQRIIGLVVVIALVIILFPILFGKNESAVKSLAKNASTSAAEQSPVTAENNATDISNEIAIPPAEADTQPSDVAAAQPNTAEITSEIADEVNKNIEAEASKVQTITKPAEATTLPAAPVLQNTSNVVSALNTPSSAQDKPSAAPSVATHTEVTPKVKNVRAKANSTDLAKLKKTAWVIQMGSFRDKENARHLADKLRTAGYKAFMHEAKSGATRVFIGPEFKQTSAMKLSSDVERDTKMRGIVVIYKPLAI